MCFNMTALDELYINVLGLFTPFHIWTLSLSLSQPEHTHTHMLTHMLTSTYETNAHTICNILKGYLHWRNTFMLDQPNRTMIELIFVP